MSQKHPAFDPLVEYAEQNRSFTSGSLVALSDVARVYDLPVGYLDDEYEKLAEEGYIRRKVYDEPLIRATADGFSWYQNSGGEVPFLKNHYPELIREVLMTAEFPDSIWPEYDDLKEKTELYGKTLLPVWYLNEIGHVRVSGKFTHPGTVRLTNEGEAAAKKQSVDLESIPRPTFEVKRVD